MKQRTLEENYLWKDNYKVHLYSFLLKNLTIRDENSPLQNEINFFNEHPEKGKIIHFELAGSLFYANILPAFIRNELIKTYNKWSWDRLNKIPEMIFDDMLQ